VGQLQILAGHDVASRGGAGKELLKAAWKSPKRESVNAANCRERATRALQSIYAHVICYLCPPTRRERCLSELAQHLGKERASRSQLRDVVLTKLEGQIAQCSSLYSPQRIQSEVLEEFQGNKDTKGKRKSGIFYKATVRIGHCK
jgi:hypothetical protein